MRVLILGASGMLGHTLLHCLTRGSDWDIRGTIRTEKGLSLFPPSLQKQLVSGVDALDDSGLGQTLDNMRPDVVINTVGLVRQLSQGREYLPCINLNARFPHILYEQCKQRNVRLVHYSTDCVFNGHKGKPYTEEDDPTASDIYGLTKYLGEIDAPGAITLRTSVIGHELRNKASLMEWFLAQSQPIKGYRLALFTGLPAVEHARVLMEYILPHDDLHGLYQVAADPISKYELLQLANAQYDKNITIHPDDSVNEDKRLDGRKFFQATGYRAPSWETLMKEMYAAQLEWNALF